jgi:2-dehydro-3-deoxyphosphooctonate aldolase (KDO 8-P synthase)
VLDSLQSALLAAETVAKAASAAGIPALFKASFDKANRSSPAAHRGPGLDAGLRLLAAVRAETGLPVLTDVHEPWQARPVAEVADALQIPAMLCRQTDLLTASAATGRVVNVKKGQFLSPAAAEAAVAKVVAATPDGAPSRVMLCERGTTFGYGGLVVDYAALAALGEQSFPVVLDATHAAQTPPHGAMTCSGGDLRSVLALARAGAAVGVDGIFLEVHEDPAVALVDGRLQMPAGMLAGFVEELVRIAQASEAARGR